MSSVTAPELADAAAEAVASVHERTERAQPVTGLDSLEETAFQDALMAALIARGLNVEREVRYPVHRRRKKRSEGFRCDFVVSAEADAPWWMELKLAAQYNDAGENRRLSTVLRHAAVDDVVKLSCDSELPRRALLLVLHTESEEIGEQRILMFAHRCADEGLPIEMPRVRHVGLVDRLGNRDCALALIPVGALLSR